MEERKHLAGPGVEGTVDQWCLDEFETDPKLRKRLPNSLATIIDSQIIPRLLVMQAEPGSSTTASIGDDARPQLSAATEKFASLIIAQDAHDAYALIEELRQEDFNLSEIMLELLAPTARLLGTWWEEDRIGFVDVTIGASRLKQIVHHYRRAHAFPFPQASKSILLLPAPNEAHTFGLLIISELFRNKGWTVGGGHSVDPLEADDLLKELPWDVVGFSLANDRLVDKLTEAIGRTRELSENPNLLVLVGGQAIAAAPDLCSAVGADYAVTSPEDAVRLSESAIASRNLEGWR